MHQAGERDEELRFQDGRTGCECLSVAAMRMLLVLLAMITGLSLPEMAHAVQRAEVADTGVAASASASAEQRQQRCAGRGGAVPQKRSNARRKTVWLPAPALIRPCGIELSDRARE